MTLEPIGIDGLGLAFPSYRVSLEALARARGVAPEKYTKGLGCSHMGFPHPAEDTVTLAAEAATRALVDFGVDKDEVGLLVCGTETAVDQAKPVASHVQGLLGLSSACRVFEIKHACYGGTAGVLTAAQWVASGAARGKKALVIAADIARYGLGTPGEPTQGAGAAAMIVSSRPRLVEVDFLTAGAWSRDVYDFWRPNSSPDAMVDGKLSLACYLEGVRESYREYRNAGGYDERELASLLFHVPFPKMATKGHAELYQLSRGEAGEPGDSFARRTAPSLTLAAETGNSYTASLWFALASAVEAGSFGAGSRAGLYSYGSGFCAEFFSATLLKTGAGTIPSARISGEGTALSVTDYEKLMAARLTRGPFEMDEYLRSSFAFLGETDGQRRYVRISESAAV